MQTIEEKMPTKEEIDYFCAPCDYKDNMQICPRYKQIEYVARDYCGHASINGVKALEMTKDRICINRTSFQRNNMDELVEAISEQRE